MICDFRCVGRISLDLEEGQVDMLGCDQRASGWVTDLWNLAEVPANPPPSQSKLISRDLSTGQGGGAGNPGRKSSHVPCVLEAPSFRLSPGKVPLAPPKKQTPALLEALLPPPQLRVTVQPFLFPGAWPGKVQGMGSGQQECRGGREIKAVLNPAVWISVFVDWMD